MVEYEAFVADALENIKRLRIERADVLPWVMSPDSCPMLVKNYTWVEFGVSVGRSLGYLASERGDATLWGCDSFRGLPQDWPGMLPRGTFAVDNIPHPPAGVNLLVGLFEDTLRSFNPGVVSFAHVDCDLYSSANTVMKWLDNHICPGVSIIAFDELYNYPGFEDHEMMALYQFCQRGHKIEWLASGENAVAVRVI